MVSVHILSNFLSNLQNHSKLKKTQMFFQQTKLIIQLATLLTNEGYIRGYKLLPNNKLIILLKYKSTSNIINKIKITSKPGKRLYIKNIKVFNTKNLYNISIISTSLGLKTFDQAKKLNQGGELICQIN